MSYMTVTKFNLILWVLRDEIMLCASWVVADVDHESYFEVIKDTLRLTPRGAVWEKNSCYITKLHCILDIMKIEIVMKTHVCGFAQ